MQLQSFTDILAEACLYEPLKSDILERKNRQHDIAPLEFNSLPVVICASSNHRQIPGHDPGQALKSLLQAHDINKPVTVPHDRISGLDFDVRFETRPTKHEGMIFAILTTVGYRNVCCLSP